MATPVYPYVPQPQPGPLPQPAPYTPGAPPVDAGTGENPVIPATFLPQGPVPLPAYEQPVPQLADQANAAAVPIPEGGYASRTVRIPLPQFRLEGTPEPWVEMRNPGMMSTDALAEFRESYEPDDPNAEALAMESLTKMVRRWCMWDGSSDDDVPPLLPELVDVAAIRRAPVGVIAAIGAAFQELQNPQ